MPEPTGPAQADCTGPAKSIRVERSEALCLTRITLDRPTRGNSLSAAMVLELADALAACHRDGTRVLCIDAGGANFCTGFDLSGLDDKDDDSLLGGCRGMNRGHDLTAEGRWQGAGSPR